jgi:steroid 5-alpha reductase family enzyme
LKRGAGGGIPAPVQSRSRSFLFDAAAYAAGLAAAWLVARWLGPGSSALAVVAYADVAATLVVFAFSVAADNTSVYDPYWSLAPLVIAPYLALRLDAEAAPAARRILVSALVIAWALRLTYNWARGFQSLAHEDWRYLDFRRKTGRLYWPVSLAGLHMFPTVQVYLGCLPLFVVMTSARPLGPLDAVAAAVTAGALAVETVADEQLRSFRARGAGGGGEIMAEGLWAYSRHPNYLGEMGFWWGLFLCGLAAAPGAWWTGLGAVSITAMFVLFSVPMLDQRSCARRPAYADHMKRVPAVLPWFPRR